jgi:NAD(P)-dependent dehydrogenase (short-subunit alcohol dehydrogenase family)
VPRTALVTGANRGIGRAAAVALGHAGLRVVATCRRDPDALAAALRAEGVDALGHELDVADDASVERCRDALAAAGVEVDVVVCNAAVLLDRGGVLDADDEVVGTTLDVNLMGPWRCARAFLPAMLERGYGRVVMVSSAAGQVSDTSGYAPAYSVSKAALNLLTRKLAIAARGHGDVKVNAMCPGWVATDMGGAGAPRTPAEAADTIVWLATLPADGPSDGFFRDRRPLAW